MDAALSNQTWDLSEISFCNQEEADIRMFLHVKHATSNAVIKTVDTEVVIFAIFCFKLLKINKLWIEFGVAGNTRYISIHVAVSSLPQSQTMCASLPFFHAFTGCDTVSSFFGIGKKSLGLLDASTF